MKNRWGVALMGHKFDIADALEYWGSSDGVVRIVRVQDNRGAAVAGLFADGLDRLSAAAEVARHAQLLLDRVNGALFVRNPRRQPIAIADVFEKAPLEAPGVAVYQYRAVLQAKAGGFRLRMRGALSAVATGGSAAPASVPRERYWIDASLSDHALGDVLIFLRGEPGWFDLWKAFEMMRDDVQRRANVKRWERTSVAWPAPDEMDRFEATANLHRHSRARRIEKPAKGWMSLEEATPFVARLVDAWMDWRGQPPAASSAP